jgi:hypothetical protein
VGELTPANQRAVRNAVNAGDFEGARAVLAETVDRVGPARAQNVIDRLIRTMVQEQPLSRVQGRAIVDEFHRLLPGTTRYGEVKVWDATPWDDKAKQGR